MPLTSAGGQRYESNARFVRWSDGSRQLLLGDEVLDVAEQDVAGDHHYLFVRHQGLIQARTHFELSCCSYIRSRSLLARCKLSSVLTALLAFTAPLLLTPLGAMSPAEQAAPRRACINRSPAVL